MSAKRVSIGKLLMRLLIGENKMGTWTRVRGQMVVGDWQAEKLEMALGKVMIAFSCSQEEWEKAFDLSDSDKTAMPMGSEGSIQWDAYHNKQKRHIVIDVYGNLRDFMDVDHIKQWFWKACAELDSQYAILEINDIASVSTFIDESRELFKIEKDMY